jgi:hypothetical protein
MMIRFYANKVAEILKIVKESSDYAELCKDIHRIEMAIDQVQKGGDWFTANQLDRELRQKYPYIDGMIAFTNSIPGSSSQKTGIYFKEKAVIENLRQDYYGILCGAAIKTDYIHSVGEFIESID